MRDSKIIFTDSGGIQEESTSLKIPCYTLRENTERPITISQGTNRLVKPKKERVIGTRPIGYRERRNGRRTS